MSYIEFFEFKDHPFRITPDVSYFYSAPSHVEALESLKYFSDSNEGFMVLTGEPGTGKTITLRKFLNEAPDHIESAYVLFPSLEPEDMFRAVLEDFGYNINSRQSKNALFSGFRDFLMEKKAQGKKIILVVDEAQNLPNRTLEELRILSNLETETDKLIQFILAGQPELDKKLASEELRQLKQRVTITLNLRYMSTEELAKYVAFRLSKAGFQGQYPDGSFYSSLHSITKGNPRLVNLLMERALMAAYVDQSKALTTVHLNSGAISLKLKRPSILPAFKNVFIAACIAGILIAAGVFGYKKFNSTPEWVVSQPKTETAQVAEPVVQESVKQEPVAVQEAPAAKPEPVKQAKAVEIIDVNKEKKAEEKPEPKKPEIKQPEKKQPEKKLSDAAYVAARVLNVRTGPGKDFDVCAQLMRGDKVKVLKKQGEWMLIAFSPIDGISEAWASRDYVIFAK